MSSNHRLFAMLTTVTNESLERSQDFARLTEPAAVCAPFAELLRHDLQARRTRTQSLLGNCAPASVFLRSRS